MTKKYVNLTLGTGSFERGFDVSLKIRDALDPTKEHKTDGFLPAMPEIPQLFYDWELGYKRSNAYKLTRIEPKLAVTTNITVEESAIYLSDKLNDWLDSNHKNWQKIKAYLQDNANKTDEIVLTIESKDDLVSRLPWHLWSWFFERYKQAEIFFNLPEYKPPYKVKTQASALSDRIKVLAILGNSTGIDTQEDLRLLKKLPNTQLKILIEPERNEAVEPFWNWGCDILYFAGHSNSSQSLRASGALGINQSDNLTVSALHNSLKQAVARGLKLVILNSCDGIGLAKDLAEIGIPLILVMREPVPDRVAQAFLKHFLTAFALQGKPFYLAMREAREKLEGLEHAFPYASWLPAVFQNPAAGTFYWQSLRNIKQENWVGTSLKNKLLSTLLASSAVTGIVVGARYFGWLQFLELPAFDRLMLLRPDEQPERRLVVINVTEEDLLLPEQKNARGSLSDLALEKLLRQIEPYQPRVIALDIYRNFPVSPERKELANRLRQNERLLAVCKASDAESDPTGVAPPPEVPKERLGFSDFISDSEHGILRRHLLLGQPPSPHPCPSSYAFSTLVALYYLGMQGIETTYTKEGFLKIGHVIFQPLSPRTGTYYKENVSGQILLNYRHSSGSPQNSIQQISLGKILTGEFAPSDIRDKAVLIGATANSIQDNWATPYGSSRTSSIPGVLVQAQMTSQILSAVLDDRPILKFWPLWGDVLWIFGWSALGAILAVQITPQLKLRLALLIGEIVLWCLCLAFLIYPGCWVPAIPPTITLLASSVVANYLKPQS